MAGPDEVTVEETRGSARFDRLRQYIARTGKKLPDNKIIVVAYPVGRVGSSAMMGLLRIAGVSAGDPARMSTAVAMNPKGFYELKSQQRLLSDLYRGIYPDVVMPPQIGLIDEIGARGYEQYERLLESEFTSFPIAIKSQRFLTLPFLWRLRSKYAIKVLVMNRNEQDSVRSIKRVWERSGNAEQRNATEEFILGWIQAWKRFGSEVRAYYPFECCDVDFDELLRDQVKGMEKIAAFTGINSPSPQQIHDWLDARLVNRDILQ